MISGRIIIYKEPLKYKKQGYSQGYWPGSEDCEDYAWSRWNSKQKYTQIMDTTLKSIINKAVNDGFIIGSRVKRANGNPGLGTIITILDRVNDAYNEDDNEFTPFKVKWDQNPLFPTGEFNYSIDDISLVSPPLLPLLENKNETISNYC